MLLLETSPLNKAFDDETLSFLQDLYVWRRPEKFTINRNDSAKFVAGWVTLWGGRQRCLQFEFDNGYIWEASITKLGSRNLIKQCRQVVQNYLDTEYERFMAA
jgi:hypothetical protein